MYKKMQDMTWQELTKWLHFLVHDDKRDIQRTLIDISNLEELGADKRLVVFIKKTADNLLALHDSFRAFRESEKEPERAAVDRYFLDYQARLDFFRCNNIPKILKYESLIEKLPDSKVREKALYALDGLKDSCIGNLYSVFRADFKPCQKVHSLKKIIEDYVRKGVMDREGHPVRVVVQGKDVPAFCDRRLVESSLANLLTDAINHTPGRPIFVRLGQKGRFAVLSVTNEGKKLSVAEMKMIGVVRYSRSKDPDRGWGKLSVAAHAKLQDGDFKAGNSRIGPKLQMFLPRKPRHMAA